MQVALESFQELTYGDEIVYIGPDKLPSPYSAPVEWRQPYTFEHTTINGTLTMSTKHNTPRYLEPEHPANDPQNWRLATPEDRADE